MPTNCKEYMTNYYHNNKDKFKRDYNTKVYCDVCEYNISHGSYQRHLSSSIHTRISKIKSNIHMIEENEDK